MSNPQTIYLDHQATTPVDPRVLEEMLPYFRGIFGNAASVQHPVGQEALGAVERARQQVASLLGADRREIIFCSGATEANNLALKGLVAGSDRDRLVVLSTEHPAVLETARMLCDRGIELVELEVDDEGQPSLSDLREAVDERTFLVSVASANNEIGTLPPLKAIAEIAHQQGAYFHTDAAQAVGKIELDFELDGIDLLSLSAHKMYGPKGAGALVVRRDLHRRLAPLIDGGGHEGGLRSGTLNVPGIVGLGVAASLAGEQRASDAERLQSLAERLLDRLHDEIDGIELNGPRSERLPGNLNLRFAGVDAEALIANCPELAISAGSACSAATPTPSHVLTAIGASQQEAEESVRIGLGRFTDPAEVDRAAEILTAAVHRIRVVASSRRDLVMGQ